jgi:hypothetical protein
MEWGIRSGERYSWISKGDKEAPGGGGYTGRRVVQGGGGGWRHERREGIRERPVRIPYRRYSSNAKECVSSCIFLSGGIMQLLFA